MLFSILFVSVFCHYYYTGNSSSSSSSSSSSISCRLFYLAALIYLNSAIIAINSNIPADPNNSSLPVATLSCCWWLSAWPPLVRYF